VGVTERRTRVRGGINTVKISMCRFNCRSQPVLTEHRVIVNHAMLYNAGGFALSPDERYIVVCVERHDIEKYDDMNDDDEMRSRSYQMSPLLLPPSLPGRTNVLAATGTMSRLSELRVSSSSSSSNPLSPPILSRSLRRHDNNNNKSKYSLNVFSIFSEPQVNGQAKPIAWIGIEEARAREITSVKFSSSCEYILLGYQKRTEGIDLLRTNNNTNNERAIGRVYRSYDMELVNTITRRDDDVNIAIFHPNQGNGIVYGTKQGRVCIVDTTTPTTYE